MPRFITTGPVTAPSDVIDTVTGETFLAYGAKQLCAALNALDKRIPYCVICNRPQTWTSGGMVCGHGHVGATTRMGWGR